MFNSINLSDIDIFKKKGEDKNIRIKKYMFQQGKQRYTKRYKSKTRFR